MVNRMSSSPNEKSDSVVEALTSSVSEAGILAPAIGSDRYSSVDVLRGFALLGLLPLNMEFFYWSPSEYGPFSLHVAHLYVDHVIVGTMRGLFSMLFGAGVILLTSRAEASGRDSELGDIYYRRLLWLLLFGVVHQHFVLWGDILYAYAIAGLFLFPLRRLSPKTLFFAGFLILLFTCYQAIYRKPPRLLQEHALWVKATDADALRAAGKMLNDEQVKAQKRWNKKNSGWPNWDEEQERSQKWRSKGYWDCFLQHYENDSVIRQGRATYHWHFWDAIYMMLFGMALMKLGVFSATRSYRFYAALAVIGYTTGVVPRVYKTYFDLANSFDLNHYFETGTYIAFNQGSDQLFRLMTTLGHAGTLLLIYKLGRLRWMNYAFAAVGRMALTNYIMQSIIVTLVFNGYGLGLHGRLQYHQHVYFVLGVWLFQMAASPIWLKYFRFGPLEWVWRSLTYWKPQPFVKGNSAAK